MSDVTEPASPPAADPNSRWYLLPLAFVLVALAFFWLWHQNDLLERRVRALEGMQPVSESDFAPIRAEVASLSRRVITLERRPAPIATSAAPSPATGAAAAAPVPAAPPTPAANSGDALAMARLASRAAAAEGQARRALRLAAATLALDAGRPLGTLPGDAPPPLLRFVAEPPPTEAALRLAFPAAARAALAATARNTAAASLGTRLWQQLGILVTVREGDRVLLGSPVSARLARTQALLDAGDLAGAVASLDGLGPAALDALATWRNEAEALLAARAALPELARD